MFGDRERIKCCVIGDFNTGKTSILRTFLDMNTKNVSTTLGIDFFSKTISIKNKQIYLTMWDTAGSERFHSLTQSYLRDSNLVIICYDLSQPYSNVVKWMRELEQNPPKVVGLLGTKLDLTRQNHENISEMIFPWSRQHYNVVQGTSTIKDPDTIKVFFKKCLSALVDEIPEQSSVIPVKLNKLRPENRKCCT